MLFVGKKAQKGPLESLLPHFLSIAHFHAKQKRIFRAGRKRPCEKIFVFWIDRADAVPGARGVREPSDSGRREGFRAVPESPRRDVGRAWGRAEAGLVRGGDYEDAPDEGEEGETRCPRVRLREGPLQSGHALRKDRPSHPLAGRPLPQTRERPFSAQALHEGVKPSREGRKALSCASMIWGSTTPLPRVWERHGGELIMPHPM